MTYPVHIIDRLPYWNRTGRAGSLPIKCSPRQFLIGKRQEQSRIATIRNGVSSSGGIAQRQGIPRVKAAMRGRSKSAQFFTIAQAGRISMDALTVAAWPGVCGALAVEDCPAIEWSRRSASRARLWNAAVPRRFPIENCLEEHLIGREPARLVRS